MNVIRATARLQRSDASLSRVAHATGLNQSTAFRILKSLVEERMLYYDEIARTYHLGVLAFELGLAAGSQSRVQEYYLPAIEEIAGKTRLTTYLMARSDTEAVCLVCKEGAAVIRAKPIEVGQRLPLGIGGGSVAILATLDDEEITEVLAVQKCDFDLYPGGRDEMARILERVEGVRRNGFSISGGSVARGVCGIGVPVLPQRGLMQLAISVSAVNDVVTPEEARTFAGIIKAAIAKLPPLPS